MTCPSGHRRTRCVAIGSPMPFTLRMTFTRMKELKLICACHMARCLMICTQSGQRIGRPPSDQNRRVCSVCCCVCRSIGGNYPCSGWVMASDAPIPLARWWLLAQAPIGTPHKSYGKTIALVHVLRFGMGPWEDLAVDRWSPPPIIPLVMLLLSHICIGVRDVTGVQVLRGVAR